MAQKILKTISDSIQDIIIRPFSARYVSYVPTISGELEENVKIWWFPCDFCQSRLGDREIGSNACTLIAVILAYRLHDQGISILGNLNLPLSRQLISALAESIVDGNEILDSLMNRGELNDINLTLPEALHFYQTTQFEWKLNDFSRRQLIEWRTSIEMEATIQARLFEVLHRGLIEWEMKGRTEAPQDSNLYFVLIADTRSVLLVYQRELKQVTLIDSHGHDKYGAVVAQVDIGNLQDLCFWYHEICATYFSRHPTCFEVSFLYIKTDSTTIGNSGTADT